MGIGHFREVDVEDLSKHKMDSERLIITPESAELINKTKRSGHKVLAVGITTIRGLETYVTTNDEVNPYDGWTNKFIFPPYDFGMSNSMISNFYHPESTMVMITAAFGGYDLVMDAYKMAVKNGYKFGCYGDAMLILDD
jgi:S-adenosylmethionine:tRNA ribosyltransferase-isomerase